jgi:hypothetical protein
MGETTRSKTYDDEDDGNNSRMRDGGRKGMMKTTTMPQPQGHNMGTRGGKPYIQQ